MEDLRPTSPRYAFVKARWHPEIVESAYKGFTSVIPAEQVDVFHVPGAFELPLVAQDLARSGRYAAIACAAFVVDGGIYRHDFMAAAVVDGLMRVSLDTGVPVLSLCLTPHQFMETEHQTAVFVEHFATRGVEAGESALMMSKTRAELAGQTNSVLA